MPGMSDGEVGEAGKFAHGHRLASAELEGKFGEPATGPRVMPPGLSAIFRACFSGLVLPAGPIDPGRRNGQQRRDALLAQACRVGFVNRALAVFDPRIEPRSPRWRLKGPTLQG